MAGNQIAFQEGSYFFPQQTYFKIEVTDLTRKMRTQHSQRGPGMAPSTAFAEYARYWLIKTPDLKPILSARE